MELAHLRLQIDMSTSPIHLQYRSKVRHRASFPYHRHTKYHQCDSILWPRAALQTGSESYGGRYIVN